jgi:hypothetical protein
MLFSLLKGVNFFDKSLKKGGKMTMAPYIGVIITFVPYKRVTFKF